MYPPMDRSETAALLHRARSGSREALDLLFSQCAPKLLAIVRLRLGATLRAQLESRDILQATFLRAFQKLHQFEGGDTSSLVAWLAQIARHELIDQADFHGRARRDAGRRADLDPVADQIAATTRSVLSRLIRDERAEALEHALHALPEHHREVIILRKLEERSFAEIAVELGKSEDACRMLLARAMTALTLELQRRGDGAKNGPAETGRPGVAEAGRPGGRGREARA